MVVAESCSGSHYFTLEKTEALVKTGKNMSLQILPAFSILMQNLYILFISICESKKYTSKIKKECYV